MDFSTENTCPRCRSEKIKSWDDLTEEQQMFARKLPLSAEYTHGKRKKHQFCTRCWFEETEKRSTSA